MAQESSRPPGSMPRVAPSPPGSAARSGAPGSGGGSRLVQWKGKTVQVGGEQAEAPAPVEPAEVANASVGASNAFMERMEKLSEEISDMHFMLTKLSERDTNNERVFNTLHAELSDYKKDFIYEHLKPVVRPLLFLYDSLEEFEGELTLYDASDSASTAPASTSAGSMPTQKVRENTVYFREQLVEALQICEVTLMEKPTGRFEPRFQRAIQVVPVDAAQDNTIQRVVRCGWFLNGQLLRPADVVVGKAAKSST